MDVDPIVEKGIIKKARAGHYVGIFTLKSTEEKAKVFRKCHQLKYKKIKVSVRDDLYEQIESYAEKPKPVVTSMREFHKWDGTNKEKNQLNVTTSDGNDTTEEETENSDADMDFDRLVNRFMREQGGLGSSGSRGLRRLRTDNG